MEPGCCVEHGDYYSRVDWGIRVERGQWYINVKGDTMDGFKIPVVFDKLSRSVGSNSDDVLGADTCDLLV